MYIEELNRFGLSEKESRIYLALLELEVATVNETAKAAQINRSSTYVLLESLKKRGLVSISAGKKIKKYVVEPPDRLVQIAERTIRTQTDIKTDLDNILPDLRSLFKGTKTKPKVRIYEGQAGIMAMLKEDFNMKEKVLRICTTGKNMPPFYKEYVPEYSKERAKRGIKMYAITTDSKLNRELSEYDLKMDETVLVPEDQFVFNSDFGVYDDVVSYISHTNQTAVVIEDKEIAEITKSLFTLAFEGAKKVGIVYNRV